MYFIYICNMLYIYIYIHVYHDGPLEINLKSIHFSKDQIKRKSPEHHGTEDLLRPFFAGDEDQELGIGRWSPGGSECSLLVRLYCFLKKNTTSSLQILSMSVLFFGECLISLPPHTRFFEASWRRAMITCCLLAPWKTWKP